MYEAPIRRDYITGIRRGREIERQTHKSSVIIASALGFAFGVMFGIVCVVAIVAL